MNSSGGARSFARIAMAAALCVLALSGCAGATRLPARAHGPEGANLEKKQLDLHFLDDAGTSRDQVLERLAPIDTGFSNPRLFWGRWSESKWGYWWIVAGGNQAAGDARRVWHTHNVLVAFDEDGLVNKKLLIDDDPALWRALHAQLADAPPLDFTQPFTMPVSGFWVSEIMLTQDSIRITRNKKKNPTFEVSPQKVVRFSHGGAPNKGYQAGTTCHTLQLAEKSPMGRKIRFCTDAPNVAILFQYLQQTTLSDMRWE